MKKKKKIYSQPYYYSDEKKGSQTVLFNNNKKSAISYDVVDIKCPHYYTVDLRCNERHSAGSRITKCSYNLYH